jgi:hypothetical protein
MKDQNSLNLCNCVHNCVNEAEENGLCSDCRLKGSTFHYLPDNGVRNDTEYQKALQEGNRRFGSLCRHERTFFGVCSYCGRRVVAAAGGVA